MDALARRLAPAQLPVALVLLAVLAYDMYLRQTAGEGLAPSVVVELVAFVAGALGVKRPSEAAGKLQEHLPD